MTPEQKLEAIQALINGEWDNPQLLKIGALFTNPIDNIQYILHF